MSRKIRFSIKESFALRVLYSFIVVIFMVLSAFTFFSVISQGEKTKKNLREQGEMMATLLADSSKVGIFAENRTLIRDTVKGIAALKDVSAIVMYNQRMKILYATDKGSHPGELAAAGESKIAVMNQDASTIVEETDRAFEFFKPVLITSVSGRDESIYLSGEAGNARAKVIGYVRVVLSKDSYRKEILGVLERNALILAVLILAGTAIISMRVKNVTRPLQKLTENVNALEKGMSVEQIAVESRDEIGNLAAAFNAMVVARGQAEKSLRESEHKFRMLAETAAAAIFIYHGGSFRYLNSTTEKLTGYTRQELLTMNIWDLVHPDYRAIIQELAAGHEGSRTFRCRFKIVSKNGEERWVDFISGDIEFEGEPASLGTAYDLTEIKKLEEQFLQAQKMEAVGILAGGIAHDFNSILTAITMYGHLAKKKKSPQDRDSFLDHIIMCSERGSNLTSRLLTFSRKQVINPKPVKINEIVAGMNKLLTHTLGEGVELKTSLSEGEMTILADIVQVEQVLTNLATNAKHAMPNGGSLTITTEPIDLDQEFIRTNGFGSVGPYARITVSDTGAGMDQKTQDRIFEPFFTTKEMGKGTGLGLSIVYGIVKQHKGYIMVSSQPGAGTTFKLYFPLVLFSALKTEVPRLPKALPGAETLLLAEDDQELRNITTTLLSDAGYTVIGAADGEQAVIKFSENKESIRLLILDIIMPGKNGKEAWKEIRSMRPDIKTLFVTAYADDLLIEEKVPPYGFEIMTKPISPDKFLGKIRTMLDA